MLTSHPLFARPPPGSTAGLGIGIGGGLGAVGAGVGIGIIFGKVIEAVTRQPEMRDEITSIQWLGFALTEACFFYGLVAGLHLLRAQVDGARFTAASSGSFLITPNVGLMVWTLLLFGLSMYVLAKLAFPRITEALDKRQHAIEESIDHAERVRHEADELLEEYRERLKEAREQAEEIVERARKAAETHERDAPGGGQGQARAADGADPA